MYFPHQLVKSAVLLIVRWEFYVDFMHPDLVHTISFVKSIGDHETCSPSMQLSESYYINKYLWPTWNNLIR